MTAGERSEDRPARFRDVLADRRFRAVWLAQLLSVVGDQVARVALAVLVFTETASAALTALTYALTFLPDLVAGPLLSGLADRYPRRATMVVTDLARAALVASMAVPGMPFGALCVLLVGVQMLAAPFLAARAAVLPALLEGDRYVAGNAMITTTYQVAQVLGFALGGPLVALVGVSSALLVDALTFVCSAVVLVRGVPETRAAAPSTRTGESLVAGVRVVRADRRLGALIALACVSAFVVTIEGLAAPYAAELGAGATTVGLLMAAHPLGAAVGIVVLTRLVTPARRARLLGPLAVASCVPLVVSAFAPGVPLLVALWVASGLACAYQAPANATFVAAVPDARRGQAFGLAVTALRVTQGLGVAAAGVVAEATHPSTAVALAGAVGLLAAALAALAWARARRSPAPELPGG